MAQRPEEVRIVPTFHLVCLARFLAFHEDFFGFVEHRTNPQPRDMLWTVEQCRALLGLAKVERRQSVACQNADHMCAWPAVKREGTLMSLLVDDVLEGDRVKLKMTHPRVERWLIC